MKTVQYKGGIFVGTEAGEALQVRSALGKLALPNGEFVQVKRAFANAGAAGDTELLPAVADRAFRILALVMLAGATATDVTFKSAGTAISPLFANAANGGAVLPLNELGWMQTVDVNQALNVTCGAGSAVGITLLYIEIPADCFDLL